jgi:hypothetical protein
MASDGYLVRVRRPVLVSLNSCRRGGNRAGDTGRYARNALARPTTRTSDTASAPISLTGETIPQPNCGWSATLVRTLTELPRRQMLRGQSKGYDRILSRGPRAWDHPVP